MTTALSIVQVCEAASASRTTVYEAIKAGELVARKRGARTLVLSDDLAAWLQSLPTISGAPRSQAA